MIIFITGIIIGILITLIILSIRNYLILENRRMNWTNVIIALICLLIIIRIFMYVFFKL